MKLFKEHKWTKFVVIGVAVLIIAAIAMIIVLNASGDKRKINKYSDEGNKYLTELDYESALASFNSIIAIDPANVDAYKGLWEAYCGLAEQEIDNAAYDKAMDYYEEAIDAAEEGRKNTDDADTFNDLINETEEKIEALEEIIGEQNSEEASADSDGSTSEAEPETLIGWCQTKDGANKLLSAPADAEDGATVYYYYDDGSVAKGYVIIDEVRYEFDKETGAFVGNAKNVRLEEIDMSWLDSVRYSNVSISGNHIFTFYFPQHSDSNYYSTNYIVYIDEYDINGNLIGSTTVYRYNGLGCGDEYGKEISEVGPVSWTATENYLFVIATGVPYSIHGTAMHVFRTSDMTETDTYTINDDNVAYYYNDYWGEYGDERVRPDYVGDVDGSKVYCLYNAGSGYAINYFTVDDSGKVQEIDYTYEYPAIDGYTIQAIDETIDGYLISTEDNSSWGYADKDGNIIQMYADASEFTNGYAMVSMDRVTYDLIDSDFNVVIAGVVNGDSASAFGTELGLFKVENGDVTTYYRVVEE